MSVIEVNPCQTDGAAQFMRLPCCRAIRIPSWKFAPASLGSWLVRPIPATCRCLEFYRNRFDFAVLLQSIFAKLTPNS